MSRREGLRQSHLPQNLLEESSQDDRQPSLPHLRYADPSLHPPPPHSRSEPPRYSRYSVPPPTRLSYPPDPPPRTDPRHTLPSQRHPELSRSHDQGVVYPRQVGYYPSEVAVAPVHQPAPRQRTAVACRYCRRRKIRCSGYQSSPDGRCTNCVQRDQKCEFLPVSASPYEAPRPEASYIAPPQSAPQAPLGGHRQSQQYNIPPPLLPSSYHLPPYTSPHQTRKSLARSAPEPEHLSPPSKRRAVDPTSSGKPNLAPIQTGATMRRRPAGPELRSEHQEPRLTPPRSDYGQHSPPYSATISPRERRSSAYSATTISPRERRSSAYSSATTVPQPFPSALLTSRSADISPYTLLPPPPHMRSPSSRVNPAYARRYSYQPQTPYSPEQTYSARPTSQPHLPSPVSNVSLPPPPIAYSRSSPTSRYASGPRRPSSEYLERPTRSPQYDHGEAGPLPPLSHLNRETPPVQGANAPTMPSPILVTLPPPSSVITAPRNPRDSAMLSALDAASDSPSSRGLPKRTPTPDPARKP